MLLYKRALTRMDPFRQEYRVNPQIIFVNTRTYGSHIFNNMVQHLTIQHRYIPVSVIEFEHPPTYYNNNQIILSWYKDFRAYYNNQISRFSTPLFL